jgi:NhaP-type Na+/H+ or K+/H+ antiporter
MNRGVGTGFMGFGVTLIVIGAILRYAVTVQTQGFDIQTAGLIALWVGFASFVVGLLLFVLAGRSRSTMRDRMVDTPNGQERIQEQDEWSTP